MNFWGWSKLCLIFTALYLYLETFLELARVLVESTCLVELIGEFLESAHIQNIFSTTLCLAC